ncbi:MAG TPA: helix-turn-helix domain-containing protein [Gaiellaceae bacterium]|jgi:putative transcriptional regulator
MVHHVSENIRRLAGMFLVEQQRLARKAGVSRQSMHAIYARRSRPSAETALQIARAFGITVEDLYAEPRECLAAAIPKLYDAPIVEPEEGMTDVVTGKVTPIKKGRK